jgi:pimeloyl-ACP methyl ester carboxylesterase
MINLIVILTSAIMFALLLLWWRWPVFRVWIEAPKYSMLRQEGRFDHQDMEREPFGFRWTSQGWSQNKRPWRSLFEIPLAPFEAGEQFPTTDVFSHIEVVDGRIWLRPEGTKYFCGDLSEQEQKLVWATQGVPQPDLFNAKAGGTAWKSKPSWYIVGKKDHTVHPDLERFFAKRMGATAYELDSSHVPMLSQPERVIDVIRTAAKAVQGASVAAWVPKDFSPECHKHR